jgi:hypothetical protein
MKWDFEKAPPDPRNDPGKLASRLAIRLTPRMPDKRLLKSFHAFLTAQKMPFDDETVRGLLHVMMSTPQFQLC